MKRNKLKFCLFLLIYMCFSMVFIFIVSGVFAYLLKGWLMWEFDKPFPFGKEEIKIICKIGLTGFPIGIILFCCYYKDIQKIR
ncbi:hypothetical protein ACL2XG_20630 [Sodalis sp. RH24]|uniref:hypothetical protein n=1 Tax=unclassified Sodalis (in: enterobacteria) TaxID=2636512 RepID=UPI0039B3B0D0